MIRERTGHLVGDHAERIEKALGFGIVCDTGGTHDIDLIVPIADYVETCFFHVPMTTFLEDHLAGRSARKRDRTLTANGALAVILDAIDPTS